MLGMQLTIVTSHHVLKFPGQSCDAHTKQPQLTFGREFQDSFEGVFLCKSKLRLKHTLTLVLPGSEAAATLSAGHSRFFTSAAMPTGWLLSQGGYWH